MVQIDPPAEVAQSPPSPQVTLGVSPVDSEAITEDGISGAFESEGQSQGGNHGGGSSFSEAPPVSDQPLHAGPPPAWQDEASWQSDQTRRHRQIVMVATLAISTLCITLLLFGWFVRTQNSSVAEVETHPSSDSPQLDPPQLDPPPLDAAPSDQAPTSALGAKSSDTSPLDTEQPAAEPSLKPEDKRGAAEVVTSESLPDLSSGLPSELPNKPLSGPSQVIPESLMPKSPIDAMSESGVSPSSPQDSQDLNAMTLQELPAGLRKFTPFLLQEGPPENTTLKAPPSIDEVDIDAAAEEESQSLGIDAPEPINVRKDLSVKVAFNSQGYPLPSLALLMSQITGVPIQIDWTSFDLAGIDVGKRIKVVGKARSARDWLDTIAAAVDGVVREEEFVIVITVSNDVFAKRELDLLDVTDFGDQAHTATQVIKAFMDEAESDGEGNDNDNDEEEEAVSVSMGTREASQLKILATELLRRMREITPKIPDRQAGRWLQTQAGSWSEWKLLDGGKSGDQVDTPITMAGMLRQAAMVNDAVCLVNWHDANRRGMRPQRLVMPHSQGNVGAMLSQTLMPWSLQVRAVDPSHWWVGSVATYDRLPVLVQTEPLGHHREDYAQQMVNIMGNASRDVYRTAYDPVSDRMLLLLPRFVARQLPKVSKSLVLRSDE